MNPSRSRRLRGGLLVNHPDVQWDGVLELPFGVLGVRCDSRQLLQTEYLTGVDSAAALAGRAGREPPAAAQPLLERLRQQLLAYCSDPGSPLDLPLACVGTPFQRRVWQALRAIPPGRVLSYGELARGLGSAARAVGQACACNPFAPLVPCHRVVARGGLGGFAGSTDAGGELLALKRWLLRHEGALPAAPAGGAAGG